MSTVHHGSRRSSAGPVGDPTGFFLLVALAGLGYAAYLFAPAMGSVTWELVLHILREPFQTSAHTLQAMIWDGVSGLLIGLLVGLFRYVFRVREKVVESIADAMWEPDAVALGKLGLLATHFVFHATCGMFAGLALGAIGMPQAPDLVLRSASAMSAAGTAVADVLLNHGYFAHGGMGGGGAPPDAFPLLALAVVFLVGLILVLAASLLTAAGFAVFARALLSGASDGFFRNLGSCIVLFLTRWWDRYRVNAMPRFQRLDFQQELERFTRTKSPEDCYPLNYYWDFLKERGQPLSVEAAVANLATFEDETKRRSNRNAPRIVRSFVGTLKYELQQRDPSQYPADALPDHLCCIGWFRWALWNGTWSGMLVGGLNVLLSMLCLIIAGQHP
jgi:hypothetical protein